MSLSEELIVSNLISEATFYVKHQEENETYLQQSQDCVDKIDNILKKNTRQSFIGLSAELIIHFCETCLLVPDKAAIAAYYIELFFQRNQSEGQYYLKGLLIKARLVSMNGHSELLKAEEMIGNLNNSLRYVSEALVVI